VGGDWYDLFVLPDRHVAITIGDVAGNGLRAAVAIGRIRSALRAYALETIDPADVLSHLDRKIRMFEPEAMATVLYAVLDPTTQASSSPTPHICRRSSPSPDQPNTLLERPSGPAGRRIRRHRPPPHPSPPARRRRHPALHRRASRTTRSAGHRQHRAAPHRAERRQRGPDVPGRHDRHTVNTPPPTTSPCSPSPARLTGTRPDHGPAWSRATVSARSSPSPAYAGPADPGLGPQGTPPLDGPGHQHAPGVRVPRPWAM
jgi:hypothetical protein